MSRLLAALALAAMIPAARAQGPVEIPSSWLQKAKGYEKALELQKQTGADIFVVFTRNASSSERGLYEWFRSKGLENSKVKKYLRDYIRVEVPLPSTPDSQRLAEKFEVRKCPAIFIVQPGGFQSYCNAFDWSGGRPKLYEPEKLIELFRARSSERYQQPAAEQDAP